MSAYSRQSLRSFCCALVRRSGSRLSSSSSGIDCRYDDRFIKEGNDLIDGIAQYRLPDGSFCHTKDGGFNETATVQAYYSFVAFRRMTEGKSPLLILDNKQTAQPSQGGSNEGGGNSNSGSQGGGSSSNEGGNSTKATAPSASKSTTTAVTGKSAGTTSTGTGITTSSAGRLTTTGTSLSVTSGASQTETAITTAQELSEKQSRRSYKPFAIIIVLAAAAVIALIIFIMGKRSYKNFIFLGAAAAAAIAVILLTDIRSPEEYYSGEKKEKDNVIGSVTMEIRCDTIAGRSESGHIPADGVILAPTAFDIESGDTVFDILTEAAQTYGIQVENKGSAGSSHGMVYISGINYIYEFDFGDLSGWVYHVNGITPSRNCGEYVLSDGDRIEWLYTCEVGHDLNEVYEE